MNGEDRQLRFAIAPGERIYAIGDVHGCEPAFERLMQAIRRDTLGRTSALTRIVLLGDIVDRGEYSARVLRTCMRYSKANGRFVVLMGNHEQLMAKALEGDQETLAMWLEVGGAKTLESFGVHRDLVQAGACDTLLAAGQNAVGVEILTWLLRLPLMYRSGSLVFVHAGVRPNVALDRQDVRDLLWSREPFLGDEEPRDFLVVHGHTIYPDGPYWGDYRIGVDTGAYETGRLSAVGLEASAGWEVSSG